MVLSLNGCTKEANPDKTETKENTENAAKPVKEDKRVSFAAVGDDLIHGAIFSDPYHQNSDGTWNYDTIYENTNYLTQAVDIANINQETILGGRELGLSHYPMFNSPQEIGDAIVKAGFDWISQASNHSLDAGQAGIESAMNFWDKYPDVVTTGINRDEKEAKRLRIIKRNGLSFGLLNYTYGTNGIIEPQGKEYLINNTDKQALKKAIKDLKQAKCDVILASMHWGSEYQFTADATQKELAQFLSDEGVNVIIGSHPHVIQPIDYLKGKNGNDTLVMYSLGNFLSAQDVDYRMLGGLAKWEIVKKGDSGKIEIENVEFYPVISHFKPGFKDFKTYALKDYSEELAASHGLNGYDGQKITRQYFIDLTHQVMKDNVKIIY
ncbi:MAG: CapA family protein [Erysipelotrichaceae bacterium]